MDLPEVIETSEGHRYLHLPGVTVAYDGSETRYLLSDGLEGYGTVAFHSDGNHLASASRDRTVRVWIVNTEELVDIACQKVWRNLTLEEWQQYIGPDIPYEATCPNLPPHPSAE